ncbi:MAG: DEAD/DEAH box helicase [Bifidobacteriaceae bacterium]|nr:DEAD/DEAH box helicase [Bifidobacteriaceae bacterium]
MSEFQSLNDFSEENSSDNAAFARRDSARDDFARRASAAEAASDLFSHDGHDGRDGKHADKKHGKHDGKKHDHDHREHDRDHDRHDHAGAGKKQRRKKADRDGFEMEPQAAEFSQDEISHDADRADLTFEQLGVPQPIVDVLAKDGKVTAFPIQADTLPDSLSGRDILGRGRTGSGKTLAFSIPLVARLGQESDGAAAMRDFKRLKKSGKAGDLRLPHPRGLVLAPTRELVNQIDEVIQPLAHAYGMKTVTIYGGVKQGRQVDKLRRGADIVLACPGRLEDLLGQGLLSLEGVEISVLDEADEMADMGFLPSVTRLLEQTDPHGQRMLFSATLDHGVDKVVDQFLTDAKVHAVADSDEPVDTMTHHLFAVTQGNKHEVIRELASGMGKRIFFTRTKFQAQKMAKKLIQQGIPAVDLQGNLSQNKRDRNLAAFADGTVRVLVATDVAARGIDVDDVELVVQTEPPKDPKSFQHRSGRTARAGKSGDVVTLVLPDQRKLARNLFRKAGIEVEPVDVVPGSDEIEALVGEHAPLVEGWSLQGVIDAEKAAKKAEKEAEKAAKAAQKAAKAAKKVRGGRRDDRDDGRGHGGRKQGGHRDDRRDAWRDDRWDDRGAGRGEGRRGGKRGAYRDYESWDDGATRRGNGKHHHDDANYEYGRAEYERSQRARGAWDDRGNDAGRADYGERNGRHDRSDYVDFGKHGKNAGKNGKRGGNASAKRNASRNSERNANRGGWNGNRGGRGNGGDRNGGRGNGGRNGGFGGARGGNHGGNRGASRGGGRGFGGRGRH